MKNIEKSFTSSELEPKPEVKSLTEREPKLTDLKIVQKPWGSIGVFKEYPDDLLEKVAQHSEKFSEQDFDKIRGVRDKFPLEISLNSGESIKLYIKRKVPVSRESYKEFYLGDKKHAGNFEDYVKEIGGQEIAELLEETPESLLKEAQSYRCLRSALNEIIINRRAKYYYEKVYGEELPIEKPVGFFIERTGERWAIFEFIEGIVNPEDLSSDIRYDIEDKGAEFAETLAERLRAIGIDPGDLDTGMKNLVITGNPRVPASLKFFVIDTEEWMPLKRGKPR